MTVGVVAVVEREKEILVLVMILIRHYEIEN
jgi:hypothetical protein